MSIGPASATYFRLLRLALLIMAIAAVLCLLLLQKEAKRELPPHSELIEASQYAMGFRYPRTEGELRALLELYERKSEVPKTRPKGAIRAVVLPHAGYSYVGEMLSGAYAALGTDYGRFIILSTEPFPSDKDKSFSLSIPRAKAYRNPFGEIPLWSTGEKLLEHEHFSSIDGAHPNYRVEIHLPFLQFFFSDFEILPVVSSYSMALKDIGEAAEELSTLLDRNTLLILSSNLSTHCPYEESSRRDLNCINSICSASPSEVLGCKASALPPLLMLKLIAEQKSWNCRVEDLKHSSDLKWWLEGDLVVGYPHLVFYESEATYGDEGKKTTSERLRDFENLDLVVESSGLCLEEK